jgi:hypothetical protein
MAHWIKQMSDCRSENCHSTVHDYQSLWCPFSVFSIWCRLNYDSSSLLHLIFCPPQNVSSACFSFRRRSFVCGLMSIIFPCLEQTDKQHSIITFKNFWALVYVCDLWRNGVWVHRCAVNSVGLRWRNRGRLRVWECHTLVYRLSQNRCRRLISRHLKHMNQFRWAALLDGSNDYI